MCPKKRGIDKVGSYTDDRYLLVKVARKYYQENLSLRQIGEKFEISVATASRLLSRAKDEGIVEITIHDLRPEYGKLENEIESTFKLKECMIIPYSDSIEAVYLDMANAVGKILQRIIKDKDLLGVSWGRNLKALAGYLPLTPKKDVRVVPIIGGAMGNIETGIYSNSISKAFADKLGGVSYLVNSPVMMESKEIRDSILGDSNFDKVISLWNQVDIALMSVSGLDPDTTVARTGLFSSGELQYLQDLGVVSLVNFNMIDEKGQPVPNRLSERIINMDFAQLKKVENVIIAASGENKVKATLAVLRSKVVDILVLDLKTARLLIKQAEQAE